MPNRSEVQQKRQHKLIGLMIKKSLSAFLISNLHNIRYLIDFDCSFGILLCFKKKMYFITDARYTIAARENAVGVEVVDIAGRKTGKVVADIVNDHRIKKLGYEPAALTVEEFSACESTATDIRWMPQRRLVEQIRVVKDKSEIEAVRTACRKTDRAFRSLLDKIRPGQTERRVRALLESELIRQGIDRLAFDSIVGSGPNGAFAHAKPSERKLRKGEFVVMDFGVCVDGYHSDMTRTIFLGKPTTEDRRRYNAVLDAQKQSFDAVVDGIDGSEPDAVARDVLDSCNLGEYFVHGLGHGVGLDVHEEPRLAPKSKSVIKTGMVYTIEPGIYIEGWGGIRIEDTVALTSGGPVALTKTGKSLIML